MTETKISMIFLKVLLNSGLIFMATMAQSSNENPENAPKFFALNQYINRLPPSIIPIHYDVMLMISNEVYNYKIQGSHSNKTIYLLENRESLIKEFQRLGNEIDHHIYFCGKSNVRINIRYATKHIYLHSKNLCIDEERTTLITNYGTVYKPSKHTYNDNILILDFTDELRSGNYNLTMEFIGGIVTDTAKGVFIMSYYDMEDHVRSIIATHFQPIGARRVFPCWDEPALKATFNITLKYDLENTALSNMPHTTEPKTTNMYGHIATEFQLTPRISTYLVAFILTNMSSEDNYTSGYLFQNYWWNRMPGQLKFAKSVANRITTFLDNNWKNYIKFFYKMKLNHIVMPDAQTGPVFLNNIMENWGIIVYRESDLIDTADSISRDIRIKRLIAYKMARQIFGNLVSPSWWSHMWLNDALVQYFGVNASNQIYPAQQIMDLFVVQDQQESLRLDNELIMMPLEVEVNWPSEIENLFSSTRYTFTLRYKAPVIIRMLQHIVTNEVFQMGIHKYLDKYSFSSATPDDLWDIIQTILDESNRSKNKIWNVKEVMNSWINKVHYPTVNVILTSYGRIIIRIDYPNVVSNLDIWWTPLTYTTQKDLNFNDTSPKHWLPSTSLLYFPNETGWIIMNLQQAGYYRVKYFAENWLKIAAFLNSDQYMKIHVLNRAQIIDDAYHFLMDDKLELRIFLELTKYLSRETDYIAWYPMFRIFEGISNALPFIRKWYIFLEAHMRNLLSGLLKNIGYEEKPKENDITKCLRQEATKWACIFRDPECVKNAAMKLYSHLENVEQRTRLKVLKCKTWTSYKSLLKKDMDPDIIVDYIKLMMPKHITFTKREAESPFWATKREKEHDVNIWAKKEKQPDVNINVIYFIAKHAENKKVLDFLLEHFHLMAPSHLGNKGQIAVLISIINHIYTQEQLNVISKALGILFPYQEQLISDFRNKIVTRIPTYLQTIRNITNLQYSSE